MLNSRQTSCLCIVIGALHSMPNMYLEVECVCPPIEIRFRQLAGKFLLKHVSNPHNSIFSLFLSLPADDMFHNLFQF